VTVGNQVEGLLRQLAPQVLGVLVRRHGQFDLCEDAVQEALLAAAVQWPQEGIPADIPGFMSEPLPARLPSTTESSRQKGAVR
jgi:predicted RNA polymerase sigma factor